MDLDALCQQIGASQFGVLHFERLMQRVQLGARHAPMEILCLQIHGLSVREQSGQSFDDGQSALSSMPIWID
jgi:hypothetical protein